MNRIERITPRDEFLIAMFNDDERLLVMFRDAELRRSVRWKNAAQITAAWIGLFAVAAVIWVGVLKAMGAW